MQVSKDLMIILHFSLDEMQDIRHALAQWKNSSLVGEQLDTQVTVTKLIIELANLDVD